MAFFTKVVEAMRRIAPLELAETAWDNVGVLIQNPRPRETSVVLLTIDLTAAVLAEAVAKRASVIVAYHPPIFSAFKRLCLDDAKQAIVLQAIVNGISVYAPHTALDACEGGINDWLLDGLTSGIAGHKLPIKPALVEGMKNTTVGQGRIFRFDETAAPMTIDDLVLRTKAHLGLLHVRVAAVTPGQSIRSIAVCAGSGSSLLRGLAVDAFVTGELGHHDALAANAAGTTVILGEHTNTERGYLARHLQPRLQDLLRQAAIEDAVVLVAESDRDPLVVV